MKASIDQLRGQALHAFALADMYLEATKELVVLPADASLRDIHIAEATAATRAFARWAKLMTDNADKAQAADNLERIAQIQDALAKLMPEVP